MTKNINFRRKMQVLILDDESDYREHYTKWVGDIGFSPIPMGNLLDAQRVLENQDIDIAIVDLFLDEQPDKVHPKGLLLIRDIIEYNNKGKKKVFVIVVTGDSRATPRITEEITKYIKQGVVTAYLEKGTEHFKKNFQLELEYAGKKIRHIAKETNIVTTRPLRVFLCHSTDDGDAVQGLYYRLKAEGDIDPWLDKEKILVGQAWDFEVESALRTSDAIVVCCSVDSVKKEGYVQKEIKRALDIADEKPEGTIFIIPLKLNECELPRRINQLQWVNLFDNDGYDKLLRALRYRASMLAS